MKEFKIHFMENNHMSQLVEAETAEQAIQRWRDRDDDYLAEESVEELNTGGVFRVEERQDGGEWKRVRLPL